MLRVDEATDAYSTLASHTCFWSQEHDLNEMKGRRHRPKNPSDIQEPPLSNPTIFDQPHPSWPKTCYATTIASTYPLVINSRDADGGGFNTSLPLPPPCVLRKE